MAWTNVSCTPLATDNWRKQQSADQLYVPPPALPTLMVFVAIGSKLVQSFEVKEFGMWQIPSYSSTPDGIKGVAWLPTTDSIRLQPEYMNYIIV